MNETDPSNRLRDISPSRKEIGIEIPAGEFEKEYEKVLGDYTQRVKIPGFRKGRAPRDMVKNLFDHDIRHDVYDALIPRFLEEELKLLGLNPVNVPSVRDLEHQDGAALRCTAAFEVLPGFELPDYRTVQVPRKTAAVDDSDVDKTLEEIRARAAEFVPVVGRGVVDGDYVTVEMQGRELKTRRLLPVEKAVVLAGHAENEPALNERLAGMTPGESRSFRVSYAQDHANRRVAGKDIEYSLKVADIKEKKLPGLDDEFAKTVGEPSGLETLKDRVRKDLLASRERAVRNETASDVLAEIGRRVSLELPESLIERESLSVLRRMLSAARGRRVPPDALEGLKAEARRQAVDHITNHLIIEKIAAKEGLGVGEDEIQAEIRNLAAANGMAPAALEQMLGSEGRREELVESILFRKTVDFLVKTAIMS